MLYYVTICYSFDSGRRKSDDALDGNVFTKIMLPQLLIKNGQGISAKSGLPGGLPSLNFKIHTSIQIMLNWHRNTKKGRQVWRPFISFRTLSVRSLR